jgi:Ser/Thr protein kinase RdoA (MazF antagonist)
MNVDIASIWDVPADATVTPMEQGGYNNELFKVQAGDRTLALRVYGNHANPKNIQHELSVLWYLNGKQLPFAVPAPLLTRRNEMWAVQQAGRERKLMVLIPFIAGANPPVDNLAQAEAAGEALGILLDAMKEIDPRGLAGPHPVVELGRVHPLVPDPFEAMNCLGSLASKKVKVRVNAILDCIYEDIKAIKALPQQLTHGDYINGNILLDGARVTGVLDFENSAFNPRASDLAIAIDTWSWDALGTGSEWARIDALGRGYSKVSRLADREISLLPSMMLLRNASVLMHLVGRFMSNLSPYADVEGWVDAMLRMDAWLIMNGKKLMEHARSW